MGTSTHIRFCFATVTHWHVDPAQGFLLHQDIESINGQLVSILHGKELAVPEQQKEDPGFGMSQA